MIMLSPSKAYYKKQQHDKDTLPLFKIDALNSETSMGSYHYGTKS